MNASAVRHCNFYPFVQPLARNSVSFVLHAAAGDLATCDMVWWKRSEPEKISQVSGRLQWSNGRTDQWLFPVTFAEEAHYIKYYFLLRDNNGRESMYNAYGFDRPVHGCFELLQVNENDVITVPEWTKGCIWYQIFPERFDRSGETAPEEPMDPWDAEPTRDNYLGGNLAGIRKRLPYLKELGIGCIYLNPVFTGDFNHKYATTDYFSVDPMFGTEEELTDLVAGAHGLGIRVVLDGVFNHVGVHFAPFADVLKNGRNSRYANWFYLKRDRITIDESCYECVGDYAYMPRLNGAEPEVRDYVRRVLLYWLEKAHIDGWRLDVADELDRQALRVWREAVSKAYPNAVLLAETWGDATALLAPGCCHSAMNYLFRDAALEYFAHRSLSAEDFRERLEDMLMKYPEINRASMYNCLGSHDTARFLTEAGGDKNSLKLAMAFQMLFPGAPAIYYGDEIGMMGENDPGCRGGMAWSRPDEELLSWQKQWIRLRKEHPALQSGEICFVKTDDKRLFAFERRGEGERILAVFNRGEGSISTDFAEAEESVDVPPRSVKIIIHQEEEL